MQKQCWKSSQLFIWMKWISPEHNNVYTKFGCQQIVNRWWLKMREYSKTYNKPRATEEWWICCYCKCTIIQFNLWWLKPMNWGFWDKKVNVLWPHAVLRGICKPSVSTLPSSRPMEQQADIWWRLIRWQQIKHQASSQLTEMSLGFSNGN